MACHSIEDDDVTRERSDEIISRSMMTSSNIRTRRESAREEKKPINLIACTNQRTAFSYVPKRFSLPLSIPLLLIFERQNDNHREK